MPAGEIFGGASSHAPTLTKIPTGLGGSRKTETAEGWSPSPQMAGHYGTTDRKESGTVTYGTRASGEIVGCCAVAGSSPYWVSFGTSLRT